MSKSLIMGLMVSLAFSVSKAGTFVGCYDKNGNTIVEKTVPVVKLEKGKLKLQVYTTSYEDTSKVRTIKTVDANENCIIVGGSTGE